MENWWKMHLISKLATGWGCIVHWTLESPRSWWLFVCDNCIKNLVRIIVPSGEFWCNMVVIAHSGEFWYKWWLLHIQLKKLLLHIQVNFDTVLQYCTFGWIITKSIDERYDNVNYYYCYYFCALRVHTAIITCYCYSYYCGYC